MHVRRRSYRDKRTGQRKTCANHTVYFRDHNEIKRELTGFANGRATQELGRRVERFVECRAAGCGPDLKLVRWLEAIPNRIKERLVAWGLLESTRMAATRPLRQHLADWKAALLAKGVTAEHPQLVTTRAGKVLAGSGFKFYRDISAGRVQQYLVQLREDTERNRGASIQTANFYLQAAKQFCRWMVRERRANDSPLVGLSGQNVRLDRRHDRRALTPDECRRLIQAAAAGPERGGMQGADRALAYQLALETGLRVREIRSLTRASFEFDADPPRLTVTAAYSKHRRDDTILLRTELAAKLQRAVTLNMPDSPVFRFPRSKNARARMIQVDLKAAGIPYCDQNGRYADWHALRHTFITNLARAGVHPRVAQSLARHCTITLTMDRYTHVLHEQEVDALSRLPDLCIAPTVVESGKTGTDGS